MIKAEARKYRHNNRHRVTVPSTTFLHEYTTETFIHMMLEY
jgi:hypothetical protein